MIQKWERMQKYKNDAEIKRLVNIIHKIEKVLQVLEPRGCGSFFFWENGKYRTK